MVGNHRYLVTFLYNVSYVSYSRTIVDDKSDHFQVFTILENIGSLENVMLEYLLQYSIRITSQGPVRGQYVHCFCGLDPRRFPRNTGSAELKLN